MKSLYCLVHQQDGFSNLLGVAILIFFVVLVLCSSLGNIGNTISNALQMFSNKLGNVFNNIP